MANGVCTRPLEAATNVRHGTCAAAAVLMLRIEHRGCTFSSICILLPTVTAAVCEQANPQTQCNGSCARPPAASLRPASIAGSHHRSSFVKPKTPRRLRGQGAGVPDQLQTRRAACTLATPATGFYQPDCTDASSSCQVNPPCEVPVHRQRGELPSEGSAALHLRS